jgi:hypothetical protein
MHVAICVAALPWCICNQTITARQSQDRLSRLGILSRLLFILCRYTLQPSTIPDEHLHRSQHLYPRSTTVRVFNAILGGVARAVLLR